VVRTISKTSRSELPASSFLLQGKALKEIHLSLVEILGAMHYHMPPSRTGWPSLNVVIFLPVLCLDLEDPEIIDQIHEQILEDRPISAKSIAKQLDISREQVSSIIREDFGL
jgi:hypothetical protein